MPDAALVAQIKKEFLALGADGRGRMDWVFKRAMDLGRGGMNAVHEATGIALSTLRRGIKNLKSGNSLPEGRQRRPGAGRRAAVEHDPRLLRTLYKLMEPRGFDNRQAPLRWTTKSTRRLARELAAKKHPIGATTVLQLLRQEGFHVEANRRSCEGQSSPDRDAQYHGIHRRLKSQQASGQPAILVEMFAPRNPGPGPRTANGEPADDDEWELMGISRETFMFAVAAIHKWWALDGHPRYPKAHGLLLIADSRVGMCDRAWKATLQRLSDVLRLEIDVGLTPPATSKLTAVEYELICRLRGIAQGQASITNMVKINAVGSLPSGSASRVETEIDAAQLEALGGAYEKERFAVNLRPSHFGAAWNYTVIPQERWHK